MLGFLLGQFVAFFGICLWAVVADSGLLSFVYQENLWAAGWLCGVVLVSAWGVARLVHEVGPRKVFDAGEGKTVRRVLAGGLSRVLGMALLSVLLVYLDRYVYDAVLLSGSVMVSALVVSVLCERRLPGACLQCGYDIRASLTFGRCPECGAGI